MIKANYKVKDVFVTYSGSCWHIYSDDLSKKKVIDIKGYSTLRPKHKPIFGNGIIVFHDGKSFQYTDNLNSDVTGISVLGNEYTEYYQEFACGGVVDDELRILGKFTNLNHDEPRYTAPPFESATYCNIPESLSPGSGTHNSGYYLGADFGNNRWVLARYQGRKSGDSNPSTAAPILYSTDGINFNIATTTLDETVCGRQTYVKFVNNKFVMFTSLGHVLTSNDGNVWINNATNLLEFSSSTEKSLIQTVSDIHVSKIHDITYNNGVYVLAADNVDDEGNDASLYTSTDLVNWERTLTTTASSSILSYPMAVHFANGMFFLFFNRSVYQSSDGYTWAKYDGGSMGVGNGHVMACVPMLCTFDD